MHSLDFSHRWPTEEATFRLRELLRGNSFRVMPSGREGFVVEDLDLVLRWYGPNFGLDEYGRLRLVEVKRWDFGFDNAQLWTFGPLAAELADWDRFDGLHLVQYSDSDHDADTRYRIGVGSCRTELSADEFLDWCLQPYSEIPPVDVGKWAFRGVA